MRKTIFCQGFGVVPENSFQFKRKLIPAERGRAVAIVSAPKRGQPPASVLHWEGVKHRGLRTEELELKFPPLLLRDRGIQKNQVVRAVPGKSRRGVLRDFEGQFTAKFLK